MKPNWFLAFPVHDTGWLQPLLQDAPAGLTRFLPTDLHCTIAFLGPASPEAARAAWEVTVANAGRPMRATLAGLRPMGRPGDPSAYSLTLDAGAEKVTRAIAALRDPTTDAAGSRRDKWDPFPHITVARPGRNAPKALLDEAAAWVERTPAVGVGVRFAEVGLYTWAEQRNRGLFRVVERAPLRR